MGTNCQRGSKFQKKYVKKTRRIAEVSIVRILKVDQALRLLLNLPFYYFNRSKPTYKSQTMNLLDNNCRMQSVKCQCSKLDTNNNFFLGEISQTVSLYLIESKFLIEGN